MLRPLVLTLAFMSVVRAQTGDPLKDRTMERAKRIGSTSLADYGKDEKRLAADYEDLLQTYAANGVKYDFLRSPEETRKFLDWRRDEYASQPASLKEELAAHDVRLDQMVMRDFQAYKSASRTPQDLARTLREMQSDQQLASAAPRAWNMAASALLGPLSFMGNIAYNQAVYNVPNKIVDSAFGPYMNPVTQLIGKNANATYNRSDRYKPGRWAEWLNKEKATATLKEGKKAQEVLEAIKKRMPESFSKIGMTAADFEKVEIGTKNGLVLIAKESNGIFTDDQLFGRNVAADAAYLREGNLAQLMGVFETKEGVMNLNMQFYIEKFKNDAPDAATRSKVEDLAHKMLALNKEMSMTVNQNNRAQAEIGGKLEAVRKELIALSSKPGIRATDLSDMLAFQTKKLNAGRQIIGAIGGYQMNKVLFPEMAGRLPPEVGQWANVLKDHLGADYVLSEYKEQAADIMEKMGYSVSSRMDESKQYLIENKMTVPQGVTSTLEELDGDCVVHALAGGVR